MVIMKKPTALRPSFACNESSTSWEIGKLISGKSKLFLSKKIEVEIPIFLSSWVVLVPPQQHLPSCISSHTRLNFVGLLPVGLPASNVYPSNHSSLFVTKYSKKSNLPVCFSLSNPLQVFLTILHHNLLVIHVVMLFQMIQIFMWRCDI